MPDEFHRLKAECRKRREASAYPGQQESTAIYRSNSSTMTIFNSAEIFWARSIAAVRAFLAAGRAVVCYKYLAVHHAHGIRVLVFRPNHLI